MTPMINLKEHVGELVEITNNLYKYEDYNYETQVFVRVNWPSEIIHKDQKYFFEGKLGKTIAADIPSARFHRCNDGNPRICSYIWLDAKGNIKED